MHSMIDPVEAEVLGTVDTALVEEDVPATITTTLYDLIAAVRAAVAPDDDPLVVATVVHLLRSRRVTFLGDPEALARWVQAPSRGRPGRKASKTRGSTYACSGRDRACWVMLCD